MRIACLQFDPHVGDVVNNLSSADDVLGNLDPTDLNGLDLLVLPELAFTGYNFKSLHHISPCFEEAGSGISSLWAQNAALNHDCAVVVGYPEKVDVSEAWPASPEYYNSALVVDGYGDVVGNYRKSFLYDTDETWALEGGNGFFKRKIPGLGNVALGICTDLNPYKLEAPWDAFEFGLHVLEAEANLVIMTMAWQTHEDAASFHRAPEEPDLDTLVYWVQRLEPLISANKEEEVIVVFCNRTGTEGDATYTGTSAVLGIKRGEVFVYGLLGRGVNGLLIVDTSQPPRSKLADADAVEGGEHVAEKPALTIDVAARQAPAVPFQAGEVSPRSLPVEHVIELPLCSPLGSPLGSPRSPRSATSPRLPWLAQAPQPGGTPVDTRSPTRLQIPTRPQLGELPPIDSAITDDVIIDTPALPSTPALARRMFRPQLGMPSSPWRFPSNSSPYPWNHHEGAKSALFGGGAALTPITPFDEDGWRTSTPIDPKTPGWFWRHEPKLTALKESIVEEEEKEEGQEEEKGEEQEEEQEEVQEEELEEEQEEEQGEPFGTLPVRSTPLEMVEKHEVLPIEPQGAFHHEPAHQATEQEEVNPEDELFLEEEPEPAPLSDWADLVLALEELRGRPGAVMDSDSVPQDRPCSPKSRYLSRDPSPFRLFRPAEMDYEREFTMEDELIFPSDPFDRPGSRGRRRRPLKRSGSLDWPSRKRRGPSRLRHAVLFPDDEDNVGIEADADTEQDLLPLLSGQAQEQLLAESMPAPDLPTATTDNDTPNPLTTATAPTTTTITTKRPPPLPLSSPTPPSSTMLPSTKQQPPPLEAVLTTPLPTATTPSLCSTTSATSATSASTFSDRHSKVEADEMDVAVAVWGEGGSVTGRPGSAHSLSLDGVVFEKKGVMEMMEIVTGVLGGVEERGLWL